MESGKVKVGVVLSLLSSSLLRLLSLRAQITSPHLGPFLPLLVLPAVQEPALLRLLQPRRGDSGQHADAAHHPEVQGQPGRGSQRQPQPGGVRQGWDSSPAPAVQRFDSKTSFNVSCLSSFCSALLHLHGPRLRVQADQQLHELLCAWRPEGSKPWLLPFFFFLMLLHRMLKPHI